MNTSVNRNENFDLKDPLSDVDTRGKDNDYRGLHLREGKGGKGKGVTGREGRGGDGRGEERRPFW